MMTTLGSSQALALETMSSSRSSYKIAQHLSAVMCNFIGGGVSLSKNEAKHAKWVRLWNGGRSDVAPSKILPRMVVLHCKMRVSLKASDRACCPSETSRWVMEGRRETGIALELEDDRLLPTTARWLIEVDWTNR